MATPTQTATQGACRVTNNQAPAFQPHEPLLMRLIAGWDGDDNDNDDYTMSMGDANTNRQHQHQWATPMQMPMPVPTEDAMPMTAEDTNANR